MAGEARGGKFRSFQLFPILSSGDLEAAADLACWEQTKSGEAIDFQIIILQEVS